MSFLLNFFLYPQHFLRGGGKFVVRSIFKKNRGPKSQNNIFDKIACHLGQFGTNLFPFSLLTKLFFCNKFLRGGGGVPNFFFNLGVGGGRQGLDWSEEIVLLEGF